jgi:hypothetical protein
MLKAEGAAAFVATVPQPVAEEGETAAQREERELIARLEAGATPLMRALASKSRSSSIREGKRGR